MSCCRLFQSIGFFVSILFIPHLVFAAVAITPVSVSTTSPIIGEPFTITASISGALSGSVYYVKCRIGAGSQSLNDGQTYNPQTTKWLDDAGANGAWVDMPQVTIGNDGYWVGDVQCRIKNTAVDEAKVVFARTCLNTNNSCGTSIQSNASLALMPVVPTPTSTPIPTQTPSPTPTNTPTHTPKPTQTVVPTETVLPTRTPRPTRIPIETPIPTEVVVFDILGTEKVATETSAADESHLLVFSLLGIGTGLGLIATVLAWQKTDIWKRALKKEKK